MKPANTSSPAPLSCRTARMMSVFGPEGGSTSGHVVRCPACRSFLAAAQQLENTLREEAPPQLIAVPHGTEDRILRAIRNAAPAKAEARLPFFRYALVGGTLAAAAVTLFEFGAMRPADRAPVASNPDYRTDAAELAAAVRALPTELEKTIAQPATALTQNNGLQREVQNVYSDAQSALAFLKLNFMPGAAEPQPSST